MGKQARQIRRNQMKRHLQQQGKKMPNRDRLRRKLTRMGIPFWEDAYKDYFLESCTNDTIEEDK